MESIRQGYEKTIEKLYKSVGVVTIRNQPASNFPPAFKIKLSLKPKNNKQIDCFFVYHEYKKNIAR